MLQNKIHSLLPSGICFIGLIYQIFEISNNYLRFITDSKVSVATHLEISSPSLSACFQIADILKRDQIKDELKINLTNPATDAEWIEYDDQISDYTIRMLFRFTPGVDEVRLFFAIKIFIINLIHRSQLITSNKDKEACIIRFPGSGNINVISDPQDCYQNFKIRKFHHRNMICYRFDPKFGRNDSLKFSDYLLQDKLFGVIFYLNLNDSYFSQVRRLAAYIHEPGSTKLLDSFLAHGMYTRDAKIILTISYETLHIQRMEPPHDTQCKYYPIESSDTPLIFEKIQNETVRLLNRSIFDVMIYDALDTPLLTSYRLQRNTTLRKIYGTIVESQSVKMPKSCIVKHTIPKMTPESYSSLGLQVTWPNGYHIFIESRPKLQLMDYIVYICSCIGTWYGLSAIGLFKLFDDVRKKYDTKSGENWKNGVPMIRQDMSRQFFTRLNKLDVKLHYQDLEIKEIWNVLS